MRLPHVTLGPLDGLGNFSNEAQQNAAEDAGIAGPVLRADIAVVADVTLGLVTRNVLPHCDTPMRICQSSWTACQ